MLITQQTSVPLSMLIKCSKLSLQSKHHLFIMPSAIEALYTAWTNCTKKEKYAIFEPALDAATCKLEEYYMKTTNSDAHIIMMSSSQSNCMMPPSKQSKKSYKADSLIHDNIEMDSEYECEGGLYSPPGIPPGIQLESRNSAGLISEFDIPAESARNIMGFVFLLLCLVIPYRVRPESVKKKLNSMERLVDFHGTSLKSSREIIHVMISRANLNM